MTKFCRAAPNFCGSSVWKLLHVAFLASRILSWLLNKSISTVSILLTGVGLRYLDYYLLTNSDFIPC